MYHSVMLKLVLVCLLVQVGANPQHLDLSGSNFNDTVQDVDDDVKDIEVPLSTSATTPLEGHHQPMALVDNNLSDEDVDYSDGSDKLYEDAAKIPETSLVTGDNRTEAGNIGDQDADPVSGSAGSDVVEDPLDVSSNASSVEIPESSIVSGGNLTEWSTEDVGKVAEEQLDGVGSPSVAPEPSDAVATDAGSALSNVSESSPESHQVTGSGSVDQEDTAASIVESEGMFTVNRKVPVALEQTLEEPVSSGDGALEPYNLTFWPEYSGDDHAESQVSSGEPELTTSAVRRPVVAPRMLFVPGMPQTPENDEEPEVVKQHGLRCEDVPCEAHHRLRVTASTAGGVVIPSGVTLTVRCSAQGPANDTAVIKWHLPPRKVSNGTLDGDEDDVERRVNITEEVLELHGHDKRVTVSILKVANVTEEDAGAYVCAAVLTQECCQRNHTLGVRIYVPPSYAVDFAIVGAVCFVEFLVILYFKTRSDRQGRPKQPASSPDNGYKADYQPVPLAERSKQVQIEEEEQQRLT